MLSNIIKKIRLLNVWKIYWKIFYLCSCSKWTSHYEIAQKGLLVKHASRRGVMKLATLEKLKSGVKEKEAKILNMEYIFKQF